MAGFEVTPEAPPPPKRQKQLATMALQPPRRPFAEYSSHHHSQVETRHVHQQSFQNIPVTAEVHPAQPSGFVTVREASFD
ncbi:MAG: hypothetical protein ACLQOO_12675, partial [Terriglobia bacterium]